MFVGHYGVSFAVKSADSTIPLWLLFIAVQLVDVFWGIFVLAGIEQVRRPFLPQNPGGPTAISRFLVCSGLGGVKIKPRIQP